MRHLLWTTTCLFAYCAYAQAAENAWAPQLDIVLESTADAGTQGLAVLLRDRIRERSQVEVQLLQGQSTENAAIFLGQYCDSPILRARIDSEGFPLPGGTAPYAESYALRRIPQDVPVQLLACGADLRGTLYAVGAILRATRYRPDTILLPQLSTSTAPAWRWRGSSANQGGTMRQITGARAWTEAESHHYMLDLALSGANLLYGSGPTRDFLRQYGLMTEYGVRPNQLRGDYPREWQSPTERGEYVCPSIPEARAALLAQWDKIFQEAQDHEVLRFFAGDPGGCRCDRCQPWGKTFVYLCADIAQLWLKYHPNTHVQIANQDVDNAGDQAIFEYLRAEPRPWLDAVCYGPGGNALSDYFRPELREDLFQYSGDGPVNRYLRETLSQLPPAQHIVHYSDITHWISAQYEVAHPEPHIAKLYGRRTFHTRPVAFYTIFHQIMPFAEGDIIYSEGYHDEFHQFLWNRLLWNPNQFLNDIMMEYATYFFGEEAAPDMVEAMLQLEKNLEAPLAENEGIQRYLKLVHAAGEKIPPNLMAIDHRWRIHMQKALMDSYFRYKLQFSISRMNESEAWIAAGLKEGDLNGALARTKEGLDRPIECSTMKAEREETDRLGKESDALFGVRENGLFAIDREITNLGWMKLQVEKALAETDPVVQRALATALIGYEDPGEGGYYEDAGNPGAQPHLVRGDSFDGTQFMDPANRLSQNTIAYNLQDPKGVVFRYTGLDPQAAYSLRVSLATPRLPRAMTGQAANIKRAEHILADTEYLARDIEVPEFTAQQFEYPVPASTTADGVLEITFERADGAMATVVSEVWLLKSSKP